MHETGGAGLSWISADFGQGVSSECLDPIFDTHHHRHNVGHSFRFYFLYGV